MLTSGRLRNGLVPSRTGFRLQRPHPGDRRVIVHRAERGPVSRPIRSGADTIPGNDATPADRVSPTSTTTPADGRRYRLGRQLAIPLDHGDLFATQRIENLVQDHQVGVER